MVSLEYTGLTILPPTTGGVPKHFSGGRNQVKKKGSWSTTTGLALTEKTRVTGNQTDNKV